MICEICKDEAFLAQKSQPAGPQDLPAASDLLETLAHHRDGCVGMAANMIGVSKRIIAVEAEDGSYLLMFNPEIENAPAPIWPRRGVSLFPAPARPNGGRASRCSGRTKNFRPASRPLPAGPPRSSSMSSTIVTAS